MLFIGIRLLFVSYQFKTDRMVRARPNIAVTYAQLHQVNILTARKYSKDLPQTNTLAYYAQMSSTKKKVL